MGLLFSDEIKEKFEIEIRNTTNDIRIVSACCKKSEIQFVEKCIVNPMKSKNNGWSLYRRLDLHAKSYILDKMRCIVGSANLTSRGLNVENNANYEIALLTSVPDEEMRRIENHFENTVLMTDGIYDLMKVCINKIMKEKQLLMNGY